MTTYLTTTTISHSPWPAFHGDINKVTVENTAYRNVISTTSTMQLVVMSLAPKQEIGAEIHPYTTQFIRIEKGNGMAYIEDKPYALSDDMAIIIPPGTKHNIVNMSSNSDLKLYTIYSPPEHPQDLVEIYKL